ncbi:TonB-dependent receptor [Flavobacterium lacus]|uniref:Carboxypeptidase-like protein n=1 Tax=Flavobacterium lacus TaxID=1353778 RepID=A0A328WQP4_9FLAO|nr:TonB-dependent receptor [Flavobacterium lacus]RAR47585.1 carboxypeptidase-like protein [Flavobacterium lacus]
MHKNFFVLVLFLLVSNLYSQNFVTVKGKIIDDLSKLPLESATVYLTSKKDSTVIDYTISEKNGNFEIRTRKNAQPLILKVSFLGYENYSKEISSINDNQELGLINLKEGGTNLDEVVVKGEAPPIRIKNDTLEFDAASFKVGADSNVEKLLKQLPGVEISPEGKITVNGKEVNQILVNGKPFFGKDGKIATQNLPAEIIEKIQVVDTKTKAEELSGETASGEEKTINLTIQEDKNKGFFGKIMGGYGSDERYESSLLLNWFKGEQKISVLASANNINSVGFSMNEIFDNMGGGRNMSVYSSDDGSFGINGMNFGGSNGLTTSNLVGVNYADKWFKKVDVNNNYFFTNAETDNVSRSSRTNLLPNETTFTESNSTSNRIGNSHNLTFNFEIKLDSTATIYLEPKFVKSLNKDRFISNQETRNQSNVLSNESASNSFSDVDDTSFENSIYYYKSFKKKERGLSLSLNNEHKKSSTFSNLNSSTFYYLTGEPDDIRNQNVFRERDFNKVETDIRFAEPITDSLKVSIGSQFTYYASKDSDATFDFDDISGSYNEFNAPLSNEIHSNVLKIYPSARLSWTKKKFRGGFGGGPEFVTFKNQSDYLAVTTQLNKNYVFPKASANLSYTISKTKSIYANYNFRMELPQANQFLPVENLSNPLNTLVGNGDLNPTQQHSLYTNFNNYDWQSRSGFFFYGGMTMSKDQIVSSTVFDESFRAQTTYENVDKGLNSYMGFSWSKSFKKEKRNLRISTGLDSGYNINQGLTNAELYEAKGWRLEPRLNLNWSIEELITIAPSYSYTFNSTDFKNYVIENANNFVHKFKLEFTSYWPKKVVFGNDFGYTYNSNIADGFQKDFYLWNTSLGYNFYKDRLLAKVKVYDVLNQNVGVRRTITPTAITDSENIVLQQYVMFSLTYKLDKFGGKKDKEGGMFFLD